MAMPRILLIVLILNTLILLGSTGLNYYLLTGGASSGALAARAPQTIAEALPATPEYQFFPIEKIIVNLRGNQNREHYFVLDLALQAPLGVDKPRIDQIEPIVRNSVVASLSALSFQELREMPISELQLRLESVLAADLAERKLTQPFASVLVSKLIVQ